MQVSTEMEREKERGEGREKKVCLFPVTVCFVRVRERDMVVRKFFLASIHYVSMEVYIIYSWIVTVVTMEVWYIGSRKLKTHLLLPISSLSVTGCSKCRTCSAGYEPDNSYSCKQCPAGNDYMFDL